MREGRDEGVKELLNITGNRPYVAISVLPVEPTFNYSI